MAHGIANEDGMMSGNGIVPWHGLGVVVEGLATSAEAIEAAGLDWEIEMMPLYLKDGTYVPQVNAIVRKDTHRILGTAGDNYRPVQNTDLFRAIDEVLSDPNGPHLETCGSLHQGRVVWLLARMPEVLRVAATDIIQPYILLTNRNTGRRSVEFSQVNVRVVCQNTLSLAEGSRASSLRIRHVTSVLDSVDDMRAAIGIARDNNMLMTEVFNRMVDTPVPTEEVDRIVAQLIPGNPNGNPINWKGTQTIREKVCTLAQKGAGNAPFNGTYWALYNGVTDYADHHKQLSRGPVDKASTMSPEETRLWSNWAGPSAHLKARTLDVIVASMETQLATTAR